MLTKEEILNVKVSPKPDFRVALELCDMSIAFIDLKEFIEGLPIATEANGWEASIGWNRAMKFVKAYLKELSC